MDSTLGRSFGKLLRRSPEGFAALGRIGGLDRVQRTFYRTMHMRLDQPIADPPLEVLPMTLLRRRMIRDVRHSPRTLATAPTTVNDPLSVARWLVRLCFPPDALNFVGPHGFEIPSATAS
jgi:hypothetical protein